MPASLRNAVSTILPAAFASLLPCLVAMASQGDDSPPCIVLADRRVAEPVKAIAEEFSRRTGCAVSVTELSPAQLAERAGRDESASDAGSRRRAPDTDLRRQNAGHGHARLSDDGTHSDASSSRPADANYTVAVWMQDNEAPELAWTACEGARKVAWKYPSGEPVWALPCSAHPDSQRLVRFLGGPTGHRLWSESKAGFTITTGKTHAEAFDWVVENRVKHTYPLTAMRMLREIGGIRDGICIDIGCGTGNLDVELAKRSDFEMIGLDIDAAMEPLFAKRVQEAGLQKRLRFVEGDAQKLPFPDDHADVIVSRGTLIFIPDIAKCLREVDRVLKPTGVAFLGGRYLYTPQQHKISTDRLREIVREAGIPGATVIENRGQWVKIAGPKAPEAAGTFQGGPEMLARRMIADYAITAGKCLLVHGNDGGLTQALQKGLGDMTELQMTALYPKEEIAEAARKRIQESELKGRIVCRVGTIEQLPFPDGAFDLVAGVGPVLIWTDRQKSMRELYRVLRPGGAALVGGRYQYMPDFRKVSSETLRSAAAETGIASIRVLDDMGQWVEVRKGIGDRKYSD